MKSLIYVLCILVSIVGCSSAPPKTTDVLLQDKNLLSSLEIEKLYSGNTLIFKNGDSEFIKSNGITFFNSSNKVMRGKWHTSENKICFNYDHLNMETCRSVLKNEGNIIHGGSKIILKTGDALKLEQKYHDYQKEIKEKNKPKPVLTASQIKAIFSEFTTFYMSGGKEFTRKDGVTFYLSKKGIKKGKWHTKKGNICFQYEDENKSHCAQIEKKGSQIIYSHKNIVLKKGDILHLGSKYYNHLKKNRENNKKLIKANGWILASTLCKANNKPHNCLRDVTPKGIVGRWAGKIISLQSRNKKFTGNMKIKITWISNISKYKCGQVISFNKKYLEDFKSRSVSMQRCKGATQPYTGFDAAADILRYIYLR